MPIIPIGQILIENGKITEKQLEDALKYQKEHPEKKLGEVLLELKFVSQKDFMLAYARRLNVPFVEVNQIEIDSEIAKLIPEATCINKNVIAIALDKGVLTVATDDPIDFYRLDDIKILTGYEVRPVLATTNAIIDAIRACYSEDKTKKVLSSLNQDFNAQEVIADLDREIASLGEKIDSAPVVQLVNTILSDSYHKGASDVHIEPGKDNTRVRLRVDGDLIKEMEISSMAHNALITRIKILSDMNIAEKRVPQDGRFSTELGEGHTLDLRVSTLPTVYGEKMVIRLLGSNSKEVTKLSQLGMSQKDYDTMMDMLRNPNGIIMVTGPTGSGKTTTLYAALDEVANDSINVVTVEDPVEKNINGINQVQVNVKAGLTFAESLRSILRQDPDIVMVGEIRDGETASIAVRAAITGHLVLSTIHTNDSIATISRLIDMGIEPYLVATSLTGIVAQRLVKTLCPHCKKEALALPEEKELLCVNGDVKIYETVGCSECNNSGYKGRTAIYEMVKITKEIIKLISKNASEEEIREVAKEQGASFLRESVTKLVLDGVTDMRQLIKATYGMDI